MKKLSIAGLIANIAIWLFIAHEASYASTPFAGANSTEARVTEFKLYGNHTEDTVSDTLEAVGYNTTEFRPLQNRTILVTAIPIDK